MNTQQGRTIMAVDQLNHIIEEVEQLSDEDLQAAHERILDILDDRKWDKLLNSPESIAYAEKRREEVIAEHLAGKTKKYIPGKSIADLFQ
jgi:hypothetical protein